MFITSVLANSFHSHSTHRPLVFMALWVRGSPQPEGMKDGEVNTQLSQHPCNPPYDSSLDWELCRCGRCRPPAPPLPLELQQRVSTQSSMSDLFSFSSSDLLISAMAQAPLLIYEIRITRSKIWALVFLKAIEEFDAEFDAWLHNSRLEPGYSDMTSILK